MHISLRILGRIAYGRVFKNTKDVEYAIAVALLVSFSVILMFIDIQLIPHLATFIDMTLLARIALVDKPAV